MSQHIAVRYVSWLYGRGRERERERDREREWYAWMHTLLIMHGHAPAVHCWEQCLDSNTFAEDRKQKPAKVHN